MGNTKLKIDYFEATEYMKYIYWKARCIIIPFAILHWPLSIMWKCIGNRESVYITLPTEYHVRMNRQQIIVLYYTCHWVSWQSFYIILATEYHVNMYVIETHLIVLKRLKPMGNIYLMYSLLNYAPRRSCGTSGASRYF